MAHKSVQRKVYFFRLADQEEFLPVIEEAFRRIDDLPFNEQGRYLPTSDDQTSLVVFVEQFSFPIKFQFGRIRRADLPLVEDGGKISPLKIAQSAGLLDWSHIIIFEDGIVTAEFNRDAPRLSRLGEYLLMKTMGALSNSPRFRPLFQRKVLEELASFDYLTALEVEAPLLDAKAIAEADKDLGAAFRAARRAGQTKNARLIFKSAYQPKNKLQRLAQKLMTTPASREALSTLKVRGKTKSETKPLDLLENYLISTEQFVKLDNRTRAINPTDAFRVLEGAYLENRGRFNDAAVADDLW